MGKEKNIETWVDPEGQYYSADDFRPLLTDKEYVAQCIGYESKYFSKAYNKLFLQFKVNVGNLVNYKEEALFMVFNIPSGKKIGTGSRYFAAWRKVHGKPPSRNAIMTPNVFLNKRLLVKTRTVKQTFDGKNIIPRDESTYYSIIDEIVKVLYDENDST